MWTAIEMCLIAISGMLLIKTIVLSQTTQVSWGLCPLETGINGGTKVEQICDWHPPPIHPLPSMGELFVLPPCLLTEVPPTETNISRPPTRQWCCLSVSACSVVTHDLFPIGCSWICIVEVVSPEPGVLWDTDPSFHCKSTPLLTASY